MLSLELVLKVLIVPHSTGASGVTHCPCALETIWHGWPNLSLFLIASSSVAEGQFGRQVERMREAQVPDALLAEVVRNSEGFAVEGKEWQ